MSGGHYDYKYFSIALLADDIEKDFINDGKYLEDDYLDTSFGRKKQIEMDYLDHSTDEERKIILDEVKSLISHLKNCAERAKNIEWFLSGDIGVENYVKLIKNYKNNATNK
jgi:hypothetical protein